jgi:hypothetical protein
LEKTSIRLINNAYAITTTLLKSKRDYVPAGLIQPAASRISRIKYSAEALRKAANDDRRSLKQSPPAEGSKMFDPEN